MRFVLDQDIPDTIARVIEQTGHEVVRLREVLPVESADEAHDRAAVLVTCNRDDFLELARVRPHSGIIVLIRRHTRLAESGNFLRLLQSAGETGLQNNINFA